MSRPDRTFLGLAGALAAAVLALAPLPMIGAARAADVATASFGATQDGRPILKTTLRNDRGMVVSAIDYGATLTAIETPDRKGVVQNVLLSQPNVAGYEATQRRYAASIGRYAGRIGGARFVLDGKAYALEPGKNGAPTVINLTNHGFFNLAGAGKGDVLGQRVWIDADRHAEVDQSKIPTGRLPPVGGTVLDFRKPALIGARLKLSDPLLASSQGFDHSLVFRTPGGPLRRVAWMEDPASGRRMEIDTTEPSAQFNSGNGFDGSEIGSEGVAYRQHGGFAFETQHLPDSPNRPSFPSATLRPDAAFHSTTVLRFTVAG